MSEIEFWKEDGVNHIIPSGTTNPEGFDPGALIRGQIGDMTITEVGCGVGRLAGSFDAESYVGVDINPTAIAQAQAAHPLHQFRAIESHSYFPFADVVLLYTVALHVSDSDIADVLNRATASAAHHVIIAEIMDRRWRRGGIPPVFNRYPDEYIAIMRSFGWQRSNIIVLPYKHYAENLVHRASGKDTNLTVLVFSKVNKGDKEYDECNVTPLRRASSILTI